MSTSRFVIAACLALGLDAAVARCARAQAAACPADIVASEPRDLLLPDGRKVEIEQPQLLRHAGELFALGAFGFAWHPGVWSGAQPDSLRAVAGYRIDSVGVAHGVPLVIKMPVAPAYLSAGGRLFAVVGSAIDTLGTRARQAWFSEWADSAWTTPVRLPASLDWGSTNRSGLVAVGDTLLVAAPDSQGFVTLLRRSGGAWTAQPVINVPISRDVALVQAGSELLLAFVGVPAGPLFAGTPAGLYAMASRDGGATWASPAVIAPTGDGHQNEVNSVQLMVSGNRVLVFWAEWFRSGLGFADLHAGLRRDDGSWQESAVWSPEGGIVAPHAIADEHGGLYVVGLTESDSVWFAHWAEGTWCSAVIPATGNAIPTPSLIRLDSAGLLLVFSQLRTSARGSPVPVTRSLLLHDCCR